MRKLAVVFGGSGFLGRQVVRALCRDGWRVRVAVRRAHQAIDLRVEGSVGQVQLVQCNIRSERSIAAAMQGTNLAINLVGILFESGQQKFDQVHAQGAKTIAQIATESGVQQLVHLSALGASEQSQSLYARSKAVGEVGVRELFPGAVILRPSVMFGSGDGLFERFAFMSMLTPILPLPKASSKMQPVFVGDVAKAVIAAIKEPSAAGNTYELGGPEILTLGQIVRFTNEQIDHKRLVLPMPGLAASAFGIIGDLMGMVPFVTPFITSDQVKLLDTDNVVNSDAIGFSELGISQLETVEAIVPNYLVRFRKYGQFHETVA